MSVSAKRIVSDLNSKYIAHFYSLIDCLNAIQEEIYFKGATDKIKVFQGVKSFLVEEALPFVHKLSKDINGKIKISELDTTISRLSHINIMASHWIEPVLAQKELSKDPARVFNQIYNRLVEIEKIKSLAISLRAVLIQNPLVENKVDPIVVFLALYFGLRENNYLC